MREKVGFNLYGIVWIGPCQPQVAPAFGPDDAAEQGPAVGRHAKAGNIFGTRLGDLRLTCLYIWTLQISSAFPEEGGLGHGVARWEGFLILPDTVKGWMILKVLSDAWEMLNE